MAEFTKQNEVNSLLASPSTVQSDDGYQLKMDYLLIKVDEMKNKLKIFTEFFSKFSLEVTSSLEVMEMELKILKKDKNDKGNQSEGERLFDMIPSTTPKNNNHSMLPNNLLTSEDNSESDSDENISVGNEINNDFSESEGQQQSEVNSHNPRDNKPMIVSNGVRKFIDEIEISEEFKTENLTIHETPANQPELSHSTVSKRLPAENTNSFKGSSCKNSYSPRESTPQKNSKLHNQTKKADNPFMLLSCDHCDYKTYRKQSLSDHMQKKHITRDQNFNKCKKCEKIYRYKLSLEKHSKLCGKLGNSKRLLKSNKKSNLVSHIQIKHLPRNSNLYKCNKFKKTYPNKPGLRYHLKVCGRPKKLNSPTGYLFCDHCTYKSNNKQTLAFHMQSKHSSDTFNCIACGRSFASQDSLRIHKSYNCKILVAHKRLSCDHCTYKCSYKSRLANHIQSKHSSDSFKCAVCGKSFVCRDNLYRHTKYSCKILVAHKRFSCDHCNYKCSSKHPLSIHMQSKHFDIFVDSI